MSNRVIITGVDLSFEDMVKLWLQFYAASCLFGVIAALLLMALAVCVISLALYSGASLIPKI